MIPRSKRAKHYVEYTEAQADRLGAFPDDAIPDDHADEVAEEELDAINEDEEG